MRRLLPRRGRSPSLAGLVLAHTSAFAGREQGPGFGVPPRLPRGIAEAGNDHEAKEGADVDRPVKQAIDFSQSFLVLVEELIADERGNARLDSTGANGDESEAKINSPELPFEQGERPVT